MSYDIGKLKKWAKYRAKLQGIDYELDGVELIEPTHCAILGLELKANKRYSGPDSPTIDRLDNTRGYVPGNVWIISNQANLMKSNASIQQLNLFSRWIRTYYGG